MNQPTYKRFVLPEMGGTEILLKVTAKGHDFDAIDYVKTQGAALSYLPEGRYTTEAVSLVERYRAWAFHAEKNIGNPDVFTRCTREMNVLSNKIAK